MTVVALARAGGRNALSPFGDDTQAVEKFFWAGLRSFGQMLASGLLFTTLFSVMQVLSAVPFFSCVSSSLYVIFVIVTG